MSKLQIILVSVCFSLITLQLVSMCWAFFLLTLLHMAYAVLLQYAAKKCIRKYLEFIAKINRVQQQIIKIDNYWKSYRLLQKLLSVQQYENSPVISTSYQNYNTIKIFEYLVLLRNQLIQLHNDRPVRLFCLPQRQEDDRKLSNNDSLMISEYRFIARILPMIYKQIDMNFKMGFTFWEGIKIINVYLSIQNMQKLCDLIISTAQECKIKNVQNKQLSKNKKQLLLQIKQCLGQQKTQMVQFLREKIQFMEKQLKLDQIKNGQKKEQLPNQSKIYSICAPSQNTDNNTNYVLKQQKTQLIKYDKQSFKNKLDQLLHKGFINKTKKYQQQLQKQAQMQNQNLEEQKSYKQNKQIKLDQDMNNQI